MSEYHSRIEEMMLLWCPITIKALMTMVPGFGVCSVCFRLCHPGCQIHHRQTATRKPRLQYVDESARIVATWPSSRQEPAFPRIDRLKLTREEWNQRDKIMDDIMDDLLAMGSETISDSAELNAWCNQQLEPWHDVSLEGLRRLKVYVGAGLMPNQNLLLVGRS